MQMEQIDKIVEWVNSLPVDELRERLIKYEVTMLVIDPVTRNIIRTMYTPYRFLLRNYTTVFGTLIGVIFKPEAFILAMEEEVKEYTKKERRKEQKWKTLEKSVVVSWEPIFQVEKLPWED